MVEDKVYKGFVSPDYSEAKQQAREEKKARQAAEAQAGEEKKARLEERKAHQAAEAEIIRLKSLLAKKGF